MASYAKRHNLREPEFTAYIALAEIHQSEEIWPSARARLKGTILIHPGPFDEEIDKRVVLEDYLFFADDYKAAETSSQRVRRN